MRMSERERKRLEWNEMELKMGSKTASLFFSGSYSPLIAAAAAITLGYRSNEMHWKQSRAKRREKSKVDSEFGNSAPSEFIYLIPLPKAGYGSSQSGSLLLAEEASFLPETLA